MLGQSSLLYTVDYSGTGQPMQRPTTRRSEAVSAGVLQVTTARLEGSESGDPTQNFPVGCVCAESPFIVEHENEEGSLPE